VTPDAVIAFAVQEPVSDWTVHPPAKLLRTLLRHKPAHTAPLSQRVPLSMKTAC
jgi:hypothetical protein